MSCDRESGAEGEEQRAEEQGAGDPRAAAPLANEGHQGQQNERHAEIAVLLADIADEVHRDGACPVQRTGEQGRRRDDEVGGVDGVAGRRKAQGRVRAAQCEQRDRHQHRQQDHVRQGEQAGQSQVPLP